MKLPETGFYNKYLLKVLLAVGFIMLFLASSLGTAQEEKLRVGITLKNDFIEVSFDETYRLVDKATGEEIVTSPGKHSFSSADGSIRIIDDTASTIGNYRGPVYLEPERSPFEKSIFTLHNSELGDKFRGALEIQNDNNKMRAINVVPLEEYLRGVVPREMPAAWGNYGGMDALKAQAVASRTYALYFQNQNRHNEYDLCDTQHCQVYGGKSSETKNTDQVIDKTRGETLKYQGQIIAPYYHATNGGYTELAQNVWSESLPFIESVHDPYDDPDNPQNIKDMVVHNHAKWETSLPVSEIENRFELNGTEGINKIDIESTFPSGRVNELQVHLVGGETLSYFKENARTLLGLRSQLFRVSESLEDRVWLSSRLSGIDSEKSVTELEGKWAINASGEKSMLTGGTFSVLGASKEAQVPHKSYLFEGKGWGHGIGMSQNGAYNRSRDGHKYRDILSFYYPGTEISLR